MILNSPISDQIDSNVDSELAKLITNVPEIV